jgi:DNA-binding HxlR family transcriptional regulator
MLRSDYRGQVCSVARALEIIGERWSLLIVRDALMGMTRFSQFQRSIGIARNVLADRLECLVRAGVLERRRHGSAHPEYVLTDKGRRLEPTILQLMKWGDAFYVAPGGPPRLTVHRDCGGEVDHELVCDRCASHVRYADIEVEPGPALRRAVGAS